MNNKVINYHAVSDSFWFENTLLHLKKRYTFISIHDLEEYYYNGKILKNSCHITVDDGDEIFCDVMYPILKKHHIPATIFVSPEICLNNKNYWFQEFKDYNQNQLKLIISRYYNTDIIYLHKISVGNILKACRIDDIKNILHIYSEQFDGKSKASQNISVNQLIKIDQEGLVTIGAHTLNHPILANEDDQNSKKEIIESISKLEGILNHGVKYFAYPNGIPFLDFDQREMEYLKLKNIRLAFTTEVDDVYKKNNPLAIPRYGLSYGSRYFVNTKLNLRNKWRIIKYLKYYKEKVLRKKLRDKFYGN